MSHGLPLTPMPISAAPITVLPTAPPRSVTIRHSFPPYYPPCSHSYLPGCQFGLSHVVPAFCSLARSFCRVSRSDTSEGGTATVLAGATWQATVRTQLGKVTTEA